MAAVIAILVMNWKRLLLLTLNEELARAEGLNKVTYELLFMFLIALAVSVSVQIVGVLLITSLLIIPPAIARVFSRSPVSMIISSVIVSIVSVLLGLFSSMEFDIATGPAIVITLGFFFFFYTILFCILLLYPLFMRVMVIKQIDTISVVMHSNINKQTYSYHVHPMR